MTAKLVYLLVQANTILDVSHSPTMLDCDKLDRTKNWQILLAAECDGVRRIAKPIVSFMSNSAGTIYYISSDLDGPFRLVGKTGDSVEVIAERLRVMHSCACFACNPQDILNGQDVDVRTISLIEAINPLKGKHNA